MAQILAHNLKPAATWGSGGASYDTVSQSIADAIDHVVNRIWPQPGERILDVATGTGWTARRLSNRGAKVTGIDIGEGVIEAAKLIAPEIDFKVGDAEALEFPDQSFDCVTSTFGVMFVSRPEAAAARWHVSRARAGDWGWSLGCLAVRLKKYSRQCGHTCRHRLTILLLRHLRGAGKAAFGNCLAIHSIWPLNLAPRYSACRAAKRYGTYL